MLIKSNCDEKISGWRRPTVALTDKSVNKYIWLNPASPSIPQNFKEAHVRPLLKKTSLPINELKKYRPVSNLNFISKILEKIVANRLQAHIKNNHLCNPLQSAYRKHHSTESALLKVHKDIIISMDKGEVTAFELIWPCCNLEMTLSWPWGKNPVKYNPNLFHHVYLGWPLPDVINVLVIGQNITTVCYFVHCAMWDSIDTRVIWRGGGASKNPSNPKCYLCNLSGVLLCRSVLGSRCVSRHCVHFKWT